MSKKFEILKSGNTRLRADLHLHIKRIYELWTQ